MRRYICYLLLTALTLLLFTGCRAYTLTDELPTLIDPQTQLPKVTAIEITRASDGANVMLTETAELNTMMLQLDGIRGTKNKSELTTFTENYPILYTITFHEDDTAEPSLYICGDEEFYHNGYGWLAIRGGMDLLYLDGLFTME